MAALVYTVKVEADFSGTAFGGVATYTDITADVLSTGIGSPIAIEQWQRDETSDPSPGTMTLTLDDASGNYTPGLASGSHYPNVIPGVKFRVSTTISGTTTVLFIGYADSWSTSYVGAVRPVTTVVCTDIMGRFGTDVPLSSPVVEEFKVSASPAIGIYPLDESEGALSAGDVSGNTLTAAVVTNSKYGAGTLTFGADTSPLYMGTGVTLSSPDSGSATTAARATYLAFPSSVLPAGAGWGYIFWFKGPTSAPANTVTLLSQASTSPATGAPFTYLDLNTSGVLVAQVNSLLVATGTTNVCDGLWHQVAVVYSSDGKTLILYVDGVGTASSIGSSAGWSNRGEAVCLGVKKTSTSVSSPFTGSIAMFATFSTATPPIGNANQAVVGWPGEGTSGRIFRLLGYRPGTTSVVVGGGFVLTNMGPQNSEGETLAQALIDCGKAEGTLVYVDTLGRIAITPRSVLFNPSVARTLNNATGEVSVDTEWRIDSQNVVNDVTISRTSGADQRAFDATSQSTYGVRADSDTLYLNSDQAALDFANFRVARGKAAVLTTPSLSVNVKTLSTAATANAVLALKPLDVVAASNLPATAPATSVTVVGRSITLAVDQFNVTFFTAPNFPAPFMVADDATLGKCDGVNVAAF